MGASFPAGAAFRSPYDVLVIRYPTQRRDNHPRDMMFSPLRRKMNIVWHRKPTRFFKRRTQSKLEQNREVGSEGEPDHVRFQKNAVELEGGTSWSWSSGRPNCSMAEDGWLVVECEEPVQFGCRLFSGKRVGLRTRRSEQIFGDARTLWTTIGHLCGARSVDRGRARLLWWRPRTRQAAQQKWRWWKI